MAYHSPMYHMEYVWNVSQHNPVRCKRISTSAGINLSQSSWSVCIAPQTVESWALTEPPRCYNDTNNKHSFMPILFYIIYPLLSLCLSLDCLSLLFPVSLNCCLRMAFHFLSGFLDFHLLSLLSVVHVSPFFQC